jgi:hypothetical protein
MKNKEYHQKHPEKVVELRKKYSKKTRNKQVMDEKRKRHRVNFETEVRLKTAEDNVITANSADISMSGLFMETNQNLEIGLECEVTLIIKGKTSKLTIVTIGKIVRHVEKSIIGIGVEFVDDLEWWSLFSIYQHYGQEKTKQ